MSILEIIKNDYNLSSADLSEILSSLSELAFEKGESEASSFLHMLSLEEKGE